PDPALVVLPSLPLPEHGAHIGIRRHVSPYGDGEIAVAAATGTEGDMEVEVHSGKSTESNLKFSGTSSRAAGPPHPRSPTHTAPPALPAGCDPTGPRDRPAAPVRRQGGRRWRSPAARGR